MSTFKDVEIIKAANIYFDGNVTSRVIKFNDGSSKTLGIMMPGEFEFSTEQHELMEILAGRAECFASRERKLANYSRRRII